MERLILTLLLGIGSISYASAQSKEVDMKRMNRDIQMMEKVINELFRYNSRSTSTWNWDGVVNTSHGLLGGINSSRGYYLPGYGVVFQTPAVPQVDNFPKRIELEGRVTGVRIAAALSETFGSGNTENHEERLARIEKEMDELQLRKADQIVGAMVEFIKSYGDAIGQLKNEEKIVLVYDDLMRSNNSVTYRRSRDSQEGQSITYRELPQPIQPKIITEVKYADVKNFRDGKMDEKALEEKILITEYNASESRSTSMQVFGNLIESLITEKGNEFDENLGSIRARTKSAYNYINGVALIYTVDVSINPLVVRSYSYSSADGQVSSTSNVRVAGVQNVTSNADSTKTFPQGNSRKRFELMIPEIKELILDYGKTLRELSDKELIVIQMNISMRNDPQVERITLSLPKKLIESYENGKISREKALEEISLVRYP